MKFSAIGNRFRKLEPVNCKKSNPISRMLDGNFNSKHTRLFKLEHHLYSTASNGFSQRLCITWDRSSNSQQKCRLLQVKGYSPTDKIHPNKTGTSQIGVFPQAQKREGFKICQGTFSMKFHKKFKTLKAFFLCSETASEVGI